MERQSIGFHFRIKVIDFMKLQQKTIEKLRQLINEETEYRTGPTLVEFFNNLGFNDSYGQGFPSRWSYTEERIKLINGTSTVNNAIKQLFSPVNFIGKFDKLTKHIADLNQYLSFDGYKVVLKGRDIVIQQHDGQIDIQGDVLHEDEFLNRDFKNIGIDRLKLDGVITAILQQRIDEIKKCLNAKASLSVIFLCGSTLEGILLGISSGRPKEFGQSLCSPKDRSGKVKPFQDWSLSDFINVARDINLVGEDVKKFSHALRDFRNYIHPYEQMSSNFNPDEHTAKICWQVLQTAIIQLSK